MINFLRIKLEKPASEVEPAIGCNHAQTDVSEGLRYCKKCFMVERFEKRRIPEPGLDAWYWRELTREEALAVVIDLQERMNS